MTKKMIEIPAEYRGMQVVEVLCERPNPGCPGYVLVYFWCKHCHRLHHHGSARINHEEYMPRHPHCSRRGNEELPYQTVLLHRVPWQRTHTQDGVTAPILDVVDWTGSGKAKVICPRCCKKHLHDVPKGVEYTLVEGRCYPLCFVRQEVPHEEISFL